MRRKSISLKFLLKLYWMKLLANLSSKVYMIEHLDLMPLNPITIDKPRCPLDRSTLRFSTLEVKSTLNLIGHQMLAQLDLSES